MTHAIAMTEAEVDASIADLDNYTGPTWQVEPMSKILADNAAKRPKNNVHVHRGSYGGSTLPDVDE